MKNFCLTLAFLFSSLPLAAAAVNYTPFYSERVNYQSGASTITMGKSPAVYIFGTATNGVVGGEISYSFLLSGAPANSYVPIQFTGQFGLIFQGDVPSTGGYWSGTRFAVSAYNGDQLPNDKFLGEGLLFEARCGVHIDGGGCGFGSGALPVSNYEQSGNSFIEVAVENAGNASIGGKFTGIIFAPTDSQGYSKGSVNLSTQTGSGTNLMSSTFLDPHFEIASDWLASHPQMAFALPAGIGNELAVNPLSPVNPVPEPGSTALFLLGLGLLLRKRSPTV